VLAKDLERLSLDPAAAPELRSLARALRARYAYPVDAQVVAPDGKLLGRLAASESLGSSDLDETYHAFLVGCLAREGVPLRRKDR
jgi:hypothetical protein